MAEPCYIHGPTTTAGTCPTCDAMQSDAKDAEITRLRAEIETTNLAWGKTSIQLGWANARLAEARAAKADAWDDGFEIGRCTGHPQINPYRSKNDAN